MEDKDLLFYIKQTGKASVPEVQMHFSISYAETRRVFRFLEANTRIKRVDALYYELCPLPEEVTYEYAWILKDCIEGRNIDVNTIKNRYGFSSFLTMTIINWLDSNHFISSSKPRYALIDMEYYNLYFSDFPKIEEPKTFNKKEPKTSDKNKFDKFFEYLDEFPKDIVDLQFEDNDKSKLDKDKYKICEKEIEKILISKPSISFEEFSKDCNELANRWSFMDKEFSNIYRNFTSLENIKNQKDLDKYKKKKLIFF